MVLLKILAILILLVLLLRLKCPFSLAMAGLALVTGLIFQLTLPQIFQSAGQTLSAKNNLLTAGAVGLILVFSGLLKNSGWLNQLTQSVGRVLGIHRITLISLPALIGLLPMPGGALFSAPLLEETARQAAPLSPRQKTVINYWFRHVWEYAWPLYPGILLVSEMTGLDLTQLCLKQAPLTLTAILTGMIFIFPGIRIQPSAESKINLRFFPVLLYRLFPIILIILLFLWLQWPLVLCLGVSIGWLICILLVSSSLKITAVFKLCFLDRNTYQLMVMVLSVFIFTGIIKSGSLTADLTVFFQNGTGSVWINYANILAVILLPFLVGFLSGLTVAFVGATFPVIISVFIPSAATDVLPFIILAYASGLAGVMLSPVHLCLVLSNQYFKARLSEVYKILIPVALSVWLMGLVLFWLY